MKGVKWRWVSLHFMTGRSLQVIEGRWRLKSSGLSVDIRHVSVVPIEVATSVEPALGAGVWVGAHLEPPERHTNRINVCRIYLFNAS